MKRSRPLTHDAGVLYGAACKPHCEADEPRPSSVGDLVRCRIGILCTDPAHEAVDREVECYSSCR